MTTGISPAAPPRERATPSTRTSGTARAPTRAAPIPAPARTWGPTPPTSRELLPNQQPLGERGAPAAAPAGACSTPSSISSAACSAAGGCEAASPLHLKNTGLGLCGFPQPKACLSLWICRYSALSPSAGAGDSAGWGGSSPSLPRTGGWGCPWRGTWPHSRSSPPGCRPGGGRRRPGWAGSPRQETPPQKRQTGRRCRS